MALRVSGNFTIPVTQKIVDTTKSLQIPTHHVQEGAVTYRKDTFIIKPLISPKPPDRLSSLRNLQTVSHLSETSRPSLVLIKFLFIGKRKFFPRE
jgi:hypothetical protein